MRMAGEMLSVIQGGLLPHQPRRLTKNSDGKVPGSWRVRVMR